MIRNFLSDVATVTIGKALDACGLRHRAIANNIANVETPGFTRSDVSFETQLKDVLLGQDDEKVMDRLEQIQPETQLDSVTPAGPDGNNVSVDREMADLVKNSLEYEALVQLANLKGFMIRTAIREGK
jgi:flagellar basal-body rod protein FlgB